MLCNKKMEKRETRTKEITPLNDDKNGSDLAKSFIRESIVNSVWQVS